jgi:small-conductance mechanosensitive channel
MEISHRATQALITAAIGLVAVIAVRVILDVVYGRYERRLKQRDPMAVARHRTTFNFTRRVIVALVAGVATWSVLSLYDVTSEIAKALLASSAVLALFAGLAFSTPLSNLGSGLLVAFTQPLRLGDRISVGGETGFVEEMALIYTTLVTDDARRIFIPNTQLTTSMIVNRTIKDPRRAVAARFPVSIDTSIDEARAALLGAIAELPGTSGESARVLVGEISDRTVWLEASTYGPMDADVVWLASELRERGLGALHDRGFLAG